MEEGEGEDGDGYCTLDIQEFVCRGTSVFAIGSSRKVSFCDEAQLSRKIGRAPVFAWFVHLVFDQIGPDWNWGLVSLFPHSV